MLIMYYSQNGQARMDKECIRNERHLNRHSKTRIDAQITLVAPIDTPLGQSV
jgi:uncharacterized membrane protein